VETRVRIPLGLPVKDQERCFSYTGSSTAYSCSSLPSSSTLATYGWSQSGDLLCRTVANSSSYSCSDPNAAFTSTYAYNGDGLRTSDQPAGDVSQEFVWNEQAELPQLMEDETNCYLYGPDGNAPVEQISISGGVDNYLVEDNQGVRYLIGRNGANDGTTKYNSYGLPSASLGTPFGFAGGYTDPNGLVYLINRYYDPATRQFLSADPLEALTGDPFGYSAEDPANGEDPNGLCSWYNVFCNGEADIEVVAQGAAEDWDSAEQGFSGVLNGDSAPQTCNSGGAGAEVSCDIGALFGAGVESVGGGEGEGCVNSEAESSEGLRPTSVNQMDEQVKRGLAPRGVQRVDQASRLTGDSQPHVHFENETQTLNQDGTWGHGDGSGLSLPNRIVAWLKGNGWGTPS
jgi:RHS repeat-associated protein